MAETRFWNWTTNRRQTQSMIDFIDERAAIFSYWNWKFPVEKRSLGSNGKALGLGGGASMSWTRSQSAVMGAKQPKQESYRDFWFMNFERNIIPSSIHHINSISEFISQGKCRLTALGAADGGHGGGTGSWLDHLQEPISGQKPTKDWRQFQTQFWQWLSR